MENVQDNTIVVEKIYVKQLNLKMNIQVRNVFINQKLHISAMKNKYYVLIFKNDLVRDMCEVKTQASTIKKCVYSGSSCTE